MPTPHAPNGTLRPARVFERGRAPLRTGDPRDVDPGLGLGGLPPNLGEDALPHVLSFQGLLRSIAKVYQASDEAIRHSRENARFMRNDSGIMECLEQRRRSTALLDWRLVPEDETSPKQKRICEVLTTILQQIPRFMQYRECLLDALWYGKSAVQQRFRWRTIRGRMRLGIDRWLPVHGDKVVFRYDDGAREWNPDQVGIRVGAGLHVGQSVGRWKVERVGKIGVSDYGLAYFLENWERPLLAIHKHMIEDGEFEAPERAGRIHGVGIRDRIYWLWYQKQESMAWLMEYLERSAFGIEVWSYPAGNDEAYQRTKTAAQERIGNGRNILLVPRHAESSVLSSDVKIVEPGMAGAEVLERILREYFGWQIKRYILGQTLTTEAGSTGLGSNLASIHLDTYLQIVRYDARNLEETLTDELVKPLLGFNFPGWAECPIRFRIQTEAPDVDAKLTAWQRAYEMGLAIPAQELADLIAVRRPESGEQVLRKRPEGETGREGEGENKPFPAAVAEQARARISQEMAARDEEVQRNSRRGEVQRYRADWDEAKHPRGQPENAGQFAEKEGGAQRRNDAETGERSSPPSRDFAPLRGSSSASESRTAWAASSRGRTVTNEATGQRVKLLSGWLETVASIAVVGLLATDFGRRLFLAAAVAGQLGDVARKGRPVASPSGHPTQPGTHRFRRYVKIDGRRHAVDLVAESGPDADAPLVYRAAFVRRAGKEGEKGREGEGEKKPAKRRNRREEAKPPQGLGRGTEQFDPARHPLASSRQKPKPPGEAAPALWDRPSEGGEGGLKDPAAIRAAWGRNTKPEAKAPQSVAQPRGPAGSTSPERIEVAPGVTMTVSMPREKTAEELAADKAARKQRRKESFADLRRARHAEAKENLGRIAAQYEVSPDDLSEAAKFVRREKAETIRERERAKARARELTGLTAGDLARMENAGFDYTAGRKVGGVTGEKLAHFDEFAGELAREHPGLIGDPDDPSANLAENLWALIREGKQEVPSIHDPDLLREAAELILAQGGGQGELVGAAAGENWEEVPFARAHHERVERFRRWRAERDRRSLPERFAAAFDESKHPRESIETDDGVFDVIGSAGGRQTQADRSEPYRHPTRSTLPERFARAFAASGWTSIRYAKKDAQGHLHAEDSGEFVEKGESSPGEPSRPDTPQGGDPEEQHRQAAVAKIEKHLSGASYLSAKQKKVYGEAAGTILRAMGAQALARWNANVRKIVYYRSTADVTRRARARDPSLPANQRIVGMHTRIPGSPGACELHLNGGSDTGDRYGRPTRDGQAHEFAHAVDYSPRTGEPLSSETEWLAAWKAELRDFPGLTPEAHESPYEGFAEFGRMAWLYPTAARRHCPRSWKFWEEKGLI